EAITQHRRRRRAAATIVVGGERPADQRRHAEAGEEVAAHPYTLGRARLAAGRQIESDAAPREQVGEHLLPIAELLPQRVAEAGPRPEELPGPAADRLRDPDLDQLARIADRQGANAHGVE